MAKESSRNNAMSMAKCPNMYNVLRKQRILTPDSTLIMNLLLNKGRLLTSLCTIYIRTTPVYCCSQNINALYGSDREYAKYAQNNVVHTMNILPNGTHLNTYKSQCNIQTKSLYICSLYTISIDCNTIWLSHK